ncbi:Protein CBG01110 [Caenorhabditis briggsae]|uniref:Protein CBG01110 n=1 Tax=Caenorhabditis briggsae TaxID=6238 RepID=A8WPK8_CAEBR|nr:Protein CBG01110 [Caenorhabditis briggsae]CAP22415.1 Protein CBG01110 [Caenorhabditis briggsae]
MPPTCPNDFQNQLDSPETVRLFSYLKDTIVLPLHLFGAYCILKKTPNNMHSVKFTLLNFHFWNVLFDLIFAFSAPIPIFPMPAAVMNGIFTRIGIPSTIQLLILVTSIDYVSVSTLMIFENRFYLLNSKKKWWKRIRPLWMIVNFSLAPLHQIPNILEFPDQKFARELVINSLPCVPEFLYTADIVLPSLNSPTIVINSILFVSIIFGQLAIFANIIIAQLYTNFGANTLSKTTRHLQKRLLKTLVLQTGIPVVSLVFPGIYAVFSIYTSHFDMGLNNLVAIVASLHGLVSTLSIILIHQPYRDTVFFWRKNKKSESKRWSIPVGSTLTNH